ncbi:MAG: sigma-70 family RNA polymerase sigma factor [Gammaproteobacteria bacterium]|nr:sigma-70 family RNA polymerase sigma factor [Gammaproteobacteria bacterium]
MNQRSSDEELMLLYAQGDMSAFEELYARFKGPLYRYLRRHFFAPAAEIDELFQDVWTRVINARQRYRPTAKFAAYLFHIAHNLITDRLRRLARNPVDNVVDFEVVAGGAGDESFRQPDRQLEFEGVQADLLRQIQKLPPEQREAFLLKEEANLSLQQIADVTGANVETVKSRLRYAVKKLRENLATRTA